MMRCPVYLRFSKDTIGIPIERPGEDPFVADFGLEDAEELAMMITTACEVLRVRRARGERVQDFTS